MRPPRLRDTKRSIFAIARDRLAAMNAAEAAAKGRKLSDEGLAEFIPRATPGHETPRHLQPLLDVLERVARGEAVRVVLSAPPRHAKALSNDTPMLTSRGWVPAGQVRIGDALVGSDGKFTAVTGVFPQGRVPLFRFRFSCGGELVACAAHRWSVRQRYGHPWVVRTTAELLPDLVEGDGRAKWRLPLVAPIEGVSAPLPLDPYLLGLWLGDGTTKQAEITTADAEVVTAFRAAGFPTSYAYPAGAATTYGLLGGLRAILRGLNVLGNKHVPDVYLRGSSQVRLAVLQGLADTDGTVAKNGSQQSITTTREQLAADIKFLVSSLGGTWTERTYPAARRVAHTVYFRLPRGMAGFRLERKANRLAAWGARNRPRRFLRSITPIGEGEATCFTVAAEDHLFCAGRDLVVTHNTETLLAAFAWLLGRHPKKVHGYATYESNLAKSKSRVARSIAQASGVRFLDDRPGRLAEWHTAAGGGLLATSVGGPFTGQGITGLLVVDDPIKNRLDAESKHRREAQWKWFTDVALTRLEPGASVIVTMARWHEDDLAGRCIKDGFEWINLPAIAESDDDARGRAPGEPLWPQRRPIEYLLELQRRLGPYSWASLYQGMPRSREGRLFRDVTLVEPDEIPRTGLRIAIGVDLAYTEQTKADWSVAVVLGYKGGKVYVLDVLRVQVEAPVFARQLRRLLDRYPGVRPIWYAAGTEKGSGQFIRRLGIPLIMRPPKGDKFVRAQPFAAAWNAGVVLVPADGTAYPWADGYVERVCEFTGSGKAEVDDEVDASAPAFDVLMPFADAGARAEASTRGKLVIGLGAQGDPLERNNELGDA